MNQTIRYGLALLLIAVLIYAAGGNDAGTVLALIGVVMCVAGLVRPAR